VESKAKIMVHPILIPFPLGLLSTSVVLDVVHLLTGNGKWSEVSFWMIATGVIGGLAAAVFGLIDGWSCTWKEARMPTKQLEAIVRQAPGVPASDGCHAS
jgi:uncharacterized membrane protein